MAPIYKIAIIQFQPKPIDIEANFKYAADEIRKAAAAGADIALLPEFHLTSWVPNHPEFVSASAASGAILSRYQDLARELNINIVPGTIVEAHTTTADPASGTTLVTTAPDDTSSGTLELRNMAFFVEAGTGKVLNRYQKTNLWHTERGHLTAPTLESASSAGSTTDWPPHKAFDTPLKWGDRFVRAGMLVCWDLAFPEAFRALVADGVDLILIPSYWDPYEDVDAESLAVNPECEVDYIRACLAARASENTVVVAFCNTGGVSQLAQPLLGLRGEIRPGATETKILEMDLDYLRVADNHYKVRADIKREGWHYEHTLRFPAKIAAPVSK
ncbi:hypothetical protein HMPREF1624_03592 [Sporothrix schenckii ATCC 58251]|uniref:CN hydrolase domain-containing protein n=1 Tax=Sporothrix schenckii (strain ATCC 58251 / de Perez 2211183) TaxID=1391915 RepID=U7Q0G6_SPOS1|nr:hypothetical protein HMPREF1624_03592 [Sporothrix schenckii ATCC 58251]